MAGGDVPVAGTGSWAGTAPGRFGSRSTPRWGGCAGSPRGGRDSTAPPSEPGGDICPVRRPCKGSGAHGHPRPQQGPALTPVSPAGRSQRSPQAAGLAEVLPEGRGAVQHPQLDVAQARGRQRGAAGRGGAELPPEQPDVSGGAGPAGPGRAPPAAALPRPASLPAPWHALVCFVPRKTKVPVIIRPCRGGGVWFVLRVSRLGSFRAVISKTFAVPQTDFFCTFAPLFLKYR